MTPQTLSVGEIVLSYEQRRGTNDLTVVFVHEAATGRWVWQKSVAALDSRLGAITYDRRGYGDTAGPVPFGLSTIEEHAEDLTAVIAQLCGDQRTLVCGHGVGAVICLDLLKRHGELIAGAVLIEPQLFSLSSSGTEIVASLREALAVGARSGGRVQAFREYARELDADAGLQEVPDDRAAEQAPAAAADLAAVTRWQFTRGDLQGLLVPTVVCVGTRSQPVWIEICNALAGALPQSRLEAADSGHFVPLEAPRTVVASVEALASP